MDYFSASAYMLTKLKVADTGQNDIWEKQSERISADRESGAIDRLVNEALIEKIQGNRPTVFDSWTLPFVTVGSPELSRRVLFVKLDSSLDSRAVKCSVSQGPKPRLSLASCKRLVRNKDGDSRRLFKSNLDIDIGSSLPSQMAHQVVVRLSKYTYGTDAEQIREGIRRAHSEIVEAISPWCMNRFESPAKG